MDPSYHIKWLIIGCCVSGQKLTFEPVSVQMLDDLSSYSGTAIYHRIPSSKDGHLNHRQINHFAGLQHFVTFGWSFV